MLVDLFLVIYQAICFPVYGIPKVNRKDHFVFDRGQLKYLNFVERVNCVYCSYGNGLFAYAREVSARTEQHWCPIKHARRLRELHSRYGHFLDYGNADQYREQIETVRNDFVDLRKLDRRKRNSSRERELIRGRLVNTGQNDGGDPPHVGLPASGPYFLGSNRTSTSVLTFTGWPFQNHRLITERAPRHGLAELYAAQRLRDLAVRANHDLALRVTAFRSPQRRRIDDGTLQQSSFLFVGRHRDFRHSFFLFLLAGGAAFRPA